MFSILKRSNESRIFQHFRNLWHLLQCYFCLNFVYVDIRCSLHDHCQLTMKMNVRQQHDKSGLCECIVVCNSIKHVAEKISVSFTCKNATGLKWKLFTQNKQILLHFCTFLLFQKTLFSYYWQYGIFYWCSERVNVAEWVVFQLYHGRNKLHVNEMMMMMMSALN